VRVERIEFCDASRPALWPKLHGKAVNLVRQVLHSIDRRHKAKEIREFYKTHGPLAFIHVELAEDRSQFSPPSGQGQRPPRRLHYEIQRRCSGGPNAIAYLSELIDPISIFSLPDPGNHINQGAQVFLWGKAKPPSLVYPPQILLRYWEWAHRRRRPPPHLPQSD